MKKYKIMVGKQGGSTMESTMSKVEDGFVVIKKWVTKEGTKYSVPQSIEKDKAGMFKDEQGKKSLTFKQLSGTGSDELWEAEVTYEFETISFEDF